LKQSYFCLANGGETAYAEFCVGMVPAKELTKQMIHHGESLYTNKFLETRCKIRLTAQPKFKDLLTALQPNARSGMSADVLQYLQKANEQLHKYLFHQHAIEPTIDSITKMPKHYKDQEYNASWQQIWWLFWCTECSPSGKKSASATMEALEESSGPSMDSAPSDHFSSPTDNSSFTGRAPSLPQFPTNERQKQYASRRDIERRNKLPRTTDGECDHSWLPHPCALNGVPAVYCKKCTVMKACIVQQTPSPSLNAHPTLATPSSSTPATLATPSSSTPAAPSAANDAASRINSISVSKQLFGSSAEVERTVVQKSNEFDEYYEALKSLEKTVWNKNVERKASSVIMCAPLLLSA
jgi:hypothetical protein